MRSACTRTAAVLITMGRRAVTGVEKRETKTPIETQKQAVDLDEKVFGRGAEAPRRVPSRGGCAHATGSGRAAL
jgi:hypothetical protein